MKLYPIHTGNLKLDGGAMFGVVPKVIWSKLYPCDENNLCNWSMRCLLAVEGERRILIDCGIGNKQSEKFFSNYYLNGEDTLEKSLANYGYTVDDITDVILTHLHFDHAGGAIRWNDERTDYIPTFKNATYRTSRMQWEWAVDPNNREKASFLKENILPIKEKGTLKFIEEDSELFPGVSIRIFNGHTNGQSIPFIRFDGKTLVYMADLLPSTAHIPLPYVMSYDTRPLITLLEKEAFLNEAAQKGYILFFEHDILHECCTVQETEKGVRLRETFPLASI
ncbi:MAG: MBL fold metallo-hydrolase [Bacteroidales bacterium]|jgi:glyoxylase-like metal-dependent hydrolase (beta-lactamase superfamily II)|nr:MBL fold metallo-hydrolase [Bacteroidales bacterium]